MTSKEQIISFLETIQTMDLPEVFDALNWVCEKRGVPYPEDSYAEKYEEYYECDRDHDECEEFIDKAIQLLEKAKES